MKLNLQNNILSHQDLKAIILEIRKYARWYSQTSVKMQITKEKSYEPIIISQAAIDIFNEWHKDQEVAQKSLDSLISALEEFESTAPRVIITLAAPPPSSLKKTLTAWYRDNVGANILVDFKFNSTLLGGMVVQYGSHVYDWSFRRQILSSRKNFAEILRRV